MMNYFTVPKGDIEKKIKEQFVNIVKRSKKLTPETKEELLKEFDLDNYYSGGYNNFSGSAFIEECVKYSVMEWVRQNQDLVDLWKRVVVESAKHSEDPELIADKAVSRFKENFEIKEDEC